MFGVKFALAVLAAMVTLVLTEVFLPYGSWTLPLQLWRAVGSRLSRTRRYSQISRIFIRHGLGRLFSGRGGSNEPSSRASSASARPPPCGWRCRSAAGRSSSWDRCCPPGATSCPRTSSTS
ncbi:hypothetical protein ACFQ0M_12065 [Kitasatospora aburaviensis]